MDRAQQTDAQFAALSSHLATRRRDILRSWRESVDRDPDLTAASSLPRTQFDDHIPELLDTLERQLRDRPREKIAVPEGQRKAEAADHGLQRWQQGYHLRDVTREWGHLQMCLVDELENYASTHPEGASVVLPTARRMLAEFCSQGVSESAAQYFHLQQVEAVGQYRDMEQALEQVEGLERQRAQLLRQAAHDLRGHVGVVRNVTSGLTQELVPPAMRDEFLRLLDKSVTSLHSMLEDVMNLARLQAGYELREVKPFDAADLLKDLCESLQPLAAERDLFLRAVGPASMPVEGDAVKTRRIAQNLQLNALKYTRAGGVTVSWGDSHKNDPERWVLSVQDTGPGFHAGPGAPVANALTEATDEARQLDAHARKAEARLSSSSSISATAVDPLPDRRPIHQEAGEGIGLSIVKRLCELLDASMELVSEPGEGTTVRVILPRRYQGTEQTG